MIEIFRNKGQIQIVLAFPQVLGSKVHGQRKIVFATRKRSDNNYGVHVVDCYDVKRLSGLILFSFATPRQ